ncbi:MAG: proline iminopeptidase-family hydrolase [Bacteroidales bacterium]|nr:proline iminopeptidase-family hydrolase [Bacteroidales bacterium]
MKKYLYSLTSLILVLLLLSSCSGNKDSKSKALLLTTGESHLAVPGGDIWYRVTGTGTNLPVVLLHGGPGGSSVYLKVFEELGNDRQVVRYDQLGSGKSDVITDTTMFTVNHFVKELDLLRDHLGLSKWHVLGHSWGTVLALEYYRAYPERVASLIFGSLCFDIPAWEQSTNQLLSTFPDSLQEAVLNAESTGNYSDPLYEEAMNQFYGKYVWGMNPVQPDFDSLMATFNADIYTYMWGPTEFSITGTLKGYDGTSLLSEIKVPTLFTVGEFDEIQPEFVKDLAEKVTDAQYVVFSGSSHMTPWDAREDNLKAVREFLNSVD